MSADSIIVGFIIAAFLVFMVSLGGVAWWSGQKPKTEQAKSPARVANPPSGLSVQS